MTYLQENSEKAIIQAILEDNKRMNGIKPWWFYQNSTAPLAWAIFKAINKRKKVNGANVLEMVDWTRCRASQEEVKLVLQPMRKPEDLEDLIKWFKTKNRLVELYEKNLDREWATPKLVVAMQKTGQYLKENYPTDKVYQFVMDLWMQHCGSEADIEHDSEAKKKKQKKQIDRIQLQKQKLINYGKTNT